MSSLLYNDDTLQSPALDTDLEDVVWSDNPETAYFRQMLEEKQMSRVADGKDMDDSILGDSTVADVLNGNYTPYVDNAQYVDDNSSYMEAAAPPSMAIIGAEDDLSTIANDYDTINGSVMKEFSSGRQSSENHPRKRDFSEYTPIKQKKNGEGSDHDTAPETPPGFIRVPDSKGSSKEVPLGDKDSQVSEGDSSRLDRSKKIFLCALCVGLILLCSISALSIVLIMLREEDTSTAGASQGPEDNQAEFGGFPEGYFTPSPSSVQAVPTGIPFQAPALAPVRAPTPAPVVATTTVAPTATPVAETPVQEAVPTLSPTITTPAYVDAQTNFLRLLADRSLSSLETLEDQQTPQFRSYLWISSDPKYFEYGPDRVIQRWVLGIFALGMTDSVGRMSSSASILSSWMENTDECTWYSSRPDTVCNADGLFQSLDIRDANLYGTIPSELSLLSNSLEQLFLPGSNLGGSIPREIGKLTLLERFQVTFNQLTGSIPTEIGRLTNMFVLGLGRNLLDGSIPSELGNMAALRTIGLEGNALTGTIPVEFGNMENMNFLSLLNNRLTGTVPRELGDIDALQELKIGHNLLSGEIPWQVCELRDLDVLKADCDKVDCSCCTDCVQTPLPPKSLSPSPTSKPTLTVSPTSTPTTSAPTPALTPSPTKATRSPTKKPTPQPTECFDEIEFVPDCIALGQNIEIRFTNCNPRSDDWIGLYDKYADAEALGAPTLWTWVCGNQRCQGAVTTGTVVLNQDNVAAPPIGQWPLDRGDYKVFLIRRNSGGPYSSYAETAKYRIKDNEC